LTPSERLGWAERAPGIDKLQELADFIRQLPEFRYRGEARIQEVTYQLHHLTEELSQATSPSR
jgi:hypothetical protein